MCVAWNLFARCAQWNRTGFAAIITIDVVKSSVEEHIAYLDHQIEQTETLIRTHINNHPRLKQHSALLDSIPGIGETTAATLLAEITDITQYESARPRRRLRGLGAAGAAIGKFGTWTHPAVKDR